MIRFAVPEIPLVDIELENIDAVRGDGTDEEVMPLKGRVAVGGPHGFKIAAEWVREDPELGKFIDRNSGRHEFYFVYLSVSFGGLGRPRLKSAKVELELAAIPATPEPFALSLEPLDAGQETQVDGRLRILPEVILPGDFGVSLGSYERGRAYARKERFVRGLGLDGPRPGWEFTRTKAEEIAGTHRLAMVVQTEKGAAISVTGRVTAQVAGNIRWRFRRELPHPLRFATAV